MCNAHAWSKQCWKSCVNGSNIEQKKCWEFSSQKLDRFQILRNNSQQHATICNRVCKRTQHATSNNVGNCWPTTLRPFACIGLNKAQLSHQYWRHFFYFANQISEEFRHVFLFSSVQWLFIHRVCPTKCFWVISLSLAGLGGREERTIVRYKGL